MTKRAETNGARVVADALRADVPVLDEVARARLEKRVVDAAVRAPRAMGAGGAPRGRMVAVGAGVLALAAAALLATMHGAEQNAGPGTATFEAMSGEQPVRRGALPEGEPIETQAGQRVRVRFARSRIEVAPETRARFERLRAEDVRVALDVGRVDVAFHPLHRGAEHLTIETPSARVEVVGTEFTVEYDAAGTTTVRVSEGVVRVVPLDGSAVRLVRAGAQTLVAAVGAARGGAVAALPGAGPAQEAPPGAAPTLAAAETTAVPRRSDLPLATPVGTRVAAQAQPEAAAEAQPEAAGAEQTAAAVEPPTAEARFAAASRLYHRSRLEEAAEALLPIAHDAHIQAGVRRDASNLLGDIYKGWRRLDDAAVEYDRACGLGSDESCYSLGGVFEALEDSGRARGAYRMYLQRAPNGALALQARARLCRPLGVSEACYGSVVTPYTP